MNKNQMNGTVDELVGCAKRKAGSITHNAQFQVEGVAQQRKGQIERALGNAQDAIKNAAGNAELLIDEQVSAGLKKPSGKEEPARITEPLSDAYRVKKPQVSDLNPRSFEPELLSSHRGVTRGACRPTSGSLLRREPCSSQADFSRLRSCCRGTALPGPTARRAARTAAAGAECARSPVCR